MQLRVLPQQIFLVLKGIILINILMLAGTWLFHYYLYNILGGNWETESNLKFLLVEFSLANENVIATWYSSVIFLTVSIVAFVCFLSRKRMASSTKERFLSYGWIVVTALFALLSFDEMASMHERLGGISNIRFLEDYSFVWFISLLVPVGIFFLFMLWFSLIEIKQAPWAVALAGIGLLIFMTIPVQEHFEVKAWHAAPDRATWMRPVHLLLFEEGSELLGATVMLASTLLFLAYMGNSKDKFSLRNSFHLRVATSRQKATISILCGSILMFLFMLFLQDNPALEIEGDHGIMLNWFPSAVAFMIFLTELFIFLRKKTFSPSVKKISLHTAIFSLFISVYYGANLCGYLGDPTTSIWKILFVLVLCVLTITLSTKMVRWYNDIYQKAGILLWCIFLVAALVVNNNYAPALAFFAFSALSISFCSRLNSNNLQP